MTAACPHCKRPFDADYPHPERFALSPLQRKIYDLLAEGASLTPEQIANKVYADDVDGGPLSATSSVAVTICNANKVLRPNGWTISAPRGRDSKGYILRPYEVTT